MTSLLLWPYTSMTMFPVFNVDLHISYNDAVFREVSNSLKGQGLI